MRAIASFWYTASAIAGVALTVKNIWHSCEDLPNHMVRHHLKVALTSVTAMLKLLANILFVHCSLDEHRTHRHVPTAISLDVTG